jgi:FAD/FMN-containing dehydrogenase
MLFQNAISPAAVLDFEAHLLGELVRPAHDDYESARRVHNLTVDRRPALIARAADAADVLRAVSFAREYDLSLAIRSGGHSMRGDGSVDDGLVIDLSRMRGLSIDPQRRVAWAQPGLTWGEYAGAAQEYGLATSSGDTGSVGLGGLTLGGGIGWMVRKHGLTIDYLQSVELVTADGRLIRASADEHPDLFWALRGGGGNFGVATAFQLRLEPAGTILGGAVVQPATADVLRGWADYAAQAPDELTTMVFLTQAPPLPFIPAEYHGQVVAIIGVCYAGDLEVGQRVVEPLRRLATPISDITSPMPYPGLFALTEQASQPEAFSVRSGFFQQLEDGLLEAVLEGVATAPAPGGVVQLRALGGAMARVPASATAFAHRDKAFMAVVIGATEDPADAPRQQEWTESVWRVVRPQADGVYVNFLGDEGPARIREAYGATTYDRLVAVKEQYDPTNLFRLNQNIRPRGD